jgi:hypothetical protein
MYGDGPIDWFFYLNMMKDRVKKENNGKPKGEGDSEIPSRKGTGVRQRFPLDAKVEGNDTNGGSERKNKGPHQGRSRVVRKRGS